MGQAFISYSRRDKDKVYAVCNILADAGFSHWLDKNDIPPTEQWRAEIVEGIKNSDSFILFISPASLSSPNVIKELNIASEQEHKGTLRIIPVVLTPTEYPKEAEYQLTGKQWVDLSGNFLKGLDDLIKTLGILSLPKGYKKHLLSYLPGTYITPELISPLSNPSREVVVGKTVSIKQIRDQRFMPRPKAIANALEEFDSHLKDREKNKEDEIFTFWIHGRSGSGKSVLLLQLMQTMVLQKNAQVFWFYSEESEKLYDLFEKWATQGIDLNEPLFVFIDDFNTPLMRDLTESKSISSLLRNPTYSNVNWPVIVTCSPPEYLEDFRNGGKDEGFRIKEWEIPTIDTEESKQLIQWFEARTGMKPKTGKAFEQSEGLALSMLFELWYFSQYADIADKNEDVMKAFGYRFKTRLESLKLIDSIAPILALNRLYLWPPNGWLEELTTEQRDAFDILVADQDFSILTLKPSASGFVRLTHPHLSDAIYQAIRPRSTSRITRSNDLASSFEKTLKNNIVQANQLLHVVAQKIYDVNDRLAPNEIDTDELSRTFTKIWMENQNVIPEENKNLPAYIWINWAIWNSKNPHISAYLNEKTIIEKALFYLGNQHRLWGRLWLTLWKCSQGNNKLIQGAIEWLYQYTDDAAWSFVWQELFKECHQLTVTEDEFLQIGINWLTKFEDRKDWNYVWRDILTVSNKFKNDLILLGRNWLVAREDHDQWAFVWQILLQHPEALPQDTSFNSLIQLGIQWLNGRENRESWSFVYEKCLQDEISDSKLLSLGVNWVITNAKRPETFGIATQLTKYSDAIPPTERYKLQNWIKNWTYKSDVKNKSWTYGWQAYWNMMPTVETAEVGLKWIEVNPENLRGATWVIFELLKGKRPDIINRITKWHENHLDHPISKTITEKLTK